MIDAQLRIDSIALTNIGSFSEMAISFGPKLNIICGPNGVGKTTILDAVSSVFVANYAMQALRRKAGTDTGVIRFNSVINKVTVEGSGEAWSQLSSATLVENFAISSAMASSGVFHPSVSLGRPLSRRAISLSSVWLAMDRSLPLGRN